MEIAEEKTRELDATLWRIGEEFELRENELALGGRAISLRTPYAEYEDVFVSLHGIHQGVNAATAIVVAEAFLGRALGEDVVTTTMASARMPGRMEVIARNPLIVVDGAHNPAGRTRLGRDARWSLRRLGGATLRARHADRSRPRRHGDSTHRCELQRVLLLRAELAARRSGE